MAAESDLGAGSVRRKRETQRRFQTCGGGVSAAPPPRFKAILVIVVVVSPLGIVTHTTSLTHTTCRDGVPGVSCLEAGGVGERKSLPPLNELAQDFCHPMFNCSENEGSCERAIKERDPGQQGLVAGD